MKSRKAFYQQHVTKSIRVMMAMFIVSYLLMFGMVLYDSFRHHLPFHYILWFDEDAQEIVRKRDQISLVLSMGLFVGV